jgi:hypothetical protein
MYGEKRYGNAEYCIFMIAKDRQIVADDGKKCTFTGSEEYLDKEVGKPIYKVMNFDYVDERSRYSVTYTTESAIVRFKMIEQLSWPKRIAARLMGFDGAYCRFTGTVALEHYEGGDLVEKLEGPAIWELMYCGSTQKSVKGLVVK